MQLPTTSSVERAPCLVRQRSKWRPLKPKDTSKQKSDSPASQRSIFFNAALLRAHNAQKRLPIYHRFLIAKPLLLPSLAAVNYALSFFFFFSAAPSLSPSSPSRFNFLCFLSRSSPAAPPCVCPNAKYLLTSPWTSPAPPAVGGAFAALIFLTISKASLSPPSCFTPPLPLSLASSSGATNACARCTKRQTPRKAASIEQRAPAWPSRPSLRLV